MSDIRHSRDVGGFRVDITSACVGSAQCVAVGDGLFILDAEGLSSFVSSEHDEASVEGLLQAVEACPTGAIEMIRL